MAVANIILRAGEACFYAGSLLVAVGFSERGNNVPMCHGNHNIANAEWIKTCWLVFVSEGLERWCIVE